MTFQQRLLAVLVGGLGFLVVDPVCAQEGLGVDTFAVVQIGDELQVVPSADVPDLRKKVQDDYQAAVKMYNESKNAAKKAGEKFNEPKPKAAVVKVLADSVGSEEEAKRILEKQQERLDKAASQGKGFVVVRVDGDYRVAPIADVAALKKQVKAEHKEAVREHAEAKKEAKKSKEKFDRPVPKAPTFQVVSSTFKTEDAANEHIEKMKEKERKKNEKKGKKKDKKKEKPDDGGVQ